MSNDGYGFSRGAEIFWRTDQTSDGVGQDIWIAYSFLDSKRKYKQFQNEIIVFKKRIQKMKPDFDKTSTLFHSKAEVEGLYQTLSEFAGINDLVISKIVKGKIKEVSKNQALAKAEGKKVTNNNQAGTKTVENIAYYTIPVDFEITGNFLGYIKFKRQLSMSQKMLNFDKESIQVVKGNTTGAIKVNGTLTIVGLADEFF